MDSCANYLASIVKCVGTFGLAPGSNQGPNTFTFDGSGGAVTYTLCGEFGVANGKRQLIS